MEAFNYSDNWNPSYDLWGNGGYAGPDRTTIYETLDWQNKIRKMMSDSGVRTPAAI